MLSYIFQYNGITLNDPSTFTNDVYASLNDVDGFSGDSLQHTEVDLVDSHGIMDYQSFLKGRLISLRGGVVSKTEEDCVALVKEIHRAFTIPVRPINRLDGYKELVFRHPKTPTVKYFVQAKIHKIPLITKKLHIHRMREFEIQLRVENPFIYGYNEISTMLDSSNSLRLNHAGGSVPSSTTPKITFEIDYDGIVQTYMKYNITGPFHSCAVRNLTNGMSQIINGIMVNSGESILVDGRTAYAYKGTTPLYPYIIGGSEWVLLNPGVNEIEIEFGSLGNVYGQTGIPEVTVSYRDVLLSM